MSKPTPYVGCKISIITKAENRYEGIIHAVDTVNSTITLAMVRLFGTEDRPTDTPVAGRDEIVEYITFGGSNIKNLTVFESECSQIQDPTIVRPSMCSAPLSTASIRSEGSYEHFNREPVLQAGHPVFPQQFGIGQSAFGSHARAAANHYHGTTIGNALTSDSQHPGTSGQSNPGLHALNRHPIPSRATPSATYSNPTAPVSMMGHNIPFYGHKAHTGTDFGLLKAQDGIELRCHTDPRKVCNPMCEQARVSNDWGRSKYSTATVGPRANNRNRGGGRRGQGHLCCDGPMRFEEDFDFESANARFNKEELNWESRGKPRLPVVNVEDNSVSPAQNSEEGKDGEPPGPNCCYDKSKSFFDQISSYDDSRKANERMGTWKEEQERQYSEAFNITSRQNRRYGGYSDHSRSVGPPHGGCSDYGCIQGDHRGLTDLPEFSFRGGYRNSQGDLPESWKDNKLSA